MTDLLCKLHGLTDVFFRHSKVAYLFIGKTDIPVRYHFSGLVAQY